MAKKMVFKNPLECTCRQAGSFGDEEDDFKGTPPICLHKKARREDGRYPICRSRTGEDFPDFCPLEDE